MTAFSKNSRRPQPQKKLVTLADRIVDVLERWRVALEAEIDAEAAAEKRRGRSERLTVPPEMAARIRASCGEHRVAEVEAELVKLLRSPARVRRLRRLAVRPPAVRAALRLIREIEADLMRERVRERTIAGIDRARREGKRVGRPPALDARGLRRLRRLRASGRSQREIGKLLGIGQTTVRRALGLPA